MSARMEDTNWLEQSFKIHEHTHIYWKTIFAVPLLIVGWSATQKNIDVSIAWLIVVHVIALEAFFTQGLLKVYALMRAGVEELKIASANNDGPFKKEIEKMKLLKNWQIISTNIVMVIISCFAVIEAAYCK